MVSLFDCDTAWKVELSWNGSNAVAWSPNIHKNVAERGRVMFILVNLVSQKQRKLLEKISMWMTAEYGWFEYSDQAPPNYINEAPTFTFSFILLINTFTFSRWASNSARAEKKQKRRSQIFIFVFSIGKPTVKSFYKTCISNTHWSVPFIFWLINTFFLTCICQGLGEHDQAILFAYFCVVNKVFNLYPPCNTIQRGRYW